MIKCSVYQDDILILNLYVSDTISSEYIDSKLSDLQRKPDKSITIEGSIPLPVI